MPMVRPPIVLTTLAVFFSLSCGKKSAETSTADASSGNNDVAEAQASDTAQSSDTAGSPQAETPVNSASAPPATALANAGAMASPLLASAGNRLIPRARAAISIYFRRAPITSTRA